VLKGLPSHADTPPSRFIALSPQVHGHSDEDDPFALVVDPFRGGVGAAPSSPLLHDITFPPLVPPKTPPPLPPKSPTSNPNNTFSPFARRAFREHRSHYRAARIPIEDRIIPPRSNPFERPLGHGRRATISMGQQFYKTVIVNQAASAEQTEFQRRLVGADHLLKSAKKQLRKGKFGAIGDPLKRAALPHQLGGISMARWVLVLYGSDL
jgi:hypothetical protein